MKQNLIAMKTKKLVTLTLLSFSFYLLSSQVPQGFNYQAIARDGAGNPIINAPLPVRITIQSDSLGGTICWIEEHSSVTTNGFGLFTLILGKGVRQPGSTVATFNDIDWKVTPKFIKTEINYNGWKNMGSSRLWSVPYSQISGGLSGSLNKLTVKGDVVSTDSTLFEVKNNTGQTIFAVYPEGVRIFVDDGIAKGVKGGFAIGGFGTAKAASQEYFRVTRDSTRVYMASPVKGVKGGFAIGGFSQGKSTIDNFMDLAPNNYFIGHLAGHLNTTGLYNSFIGYQSGFSNMTGSFNTLIGYNTGYSNVDGYNNVFLGNQAGYANTLGYNNVILGTSAGYSNIDGFSNTFIGNSAGSSNTSGFFNIFIGEQAGISNTTASRNVFVGQLAGRYNTIGQFNVFLGQQTGEANTTGSFNLFAGRSAGSFNTTGQLNTFLGINAGGANTTGNENVNLGGESGKWNSTGSYNVNLGTGAGNGNVDGNYNVSIGYYAGVALRSGSSNIFIGPGAGGGLTNTSNKLFIANSSADANNALIYGEFDTRNLTINGNLGIGKTSPATKLDIAGGNWNVLSGEGDFRVGDANYRFKIGVANSGGGAGDVRLTAQGGTNRLFLGGGGNDILLITDTNVMPWNDNYSSLGLATNRWKTIYATNGTINTSDARLKTNIREILYGLDAILKLNPVSFTWKDDSQNTQRLGLIAQDVQKVIGEVVDTGTDPAQTLGINYSEIVPVLIKGMQEQQQQIESTKQENLQLKSELQSLKEKMEQIEAMMAKSVAK